MLVQMLLIWLAANFALHVVVYLLRRRPYFALKPAAGMAAELTLVALNLTLPIVALAALPPRHPLPLYQALAWRWEGWSTIGWGLLGLVAILGSAEIINRLVGTPPFSYGGGLDRPLVLPQDWTLLLLLLALWIVTTLGEEIMFRGYVQTGLSERYGALAGLLGGALLFALRHTPADLYWGWRASTGQWTSRLVQLAVTALILGWIRHLSHSTVSTWVAHLLLWISVVIINAVGGA